MQALEDQLESDDGRPEFNHDDDRVTDDEDFVDDSNINLDLDDLDDDDDYYDER